MKRIWCLLFFQALLFTHSGALFAANAGNVLSVSRQKESYDLIRYLTYIEDPKAAFTLDEIKNPEIKNQWQPVPESSVNFGYTKSAFWFTFTLMNPEEKSLARLIEIAYPVLDYVDVYQAIPDNTIIHTQMGDKQPFARRPILHRNFILPVSLPAVTPVTFYIRVKTSSSMQVPLHLWQENAWIARSLNESLNLGLFFGIMLIIGIYNLFVFISVREIYYLFYVGFVFCMIMFLASLKGLSFQYAWPDSIVWNDRSIIIGLAGVVLFGALFIRNFINLPHNRPFSSKFMIMVAAASGLVIIATFLFPYRTMIRWDILIAVITILGATVIAIIRWKDGDISARYFMLAWSAMMLGGIILAANKFNLVPRNLFTENATSYGMAFQIILLSMVLARRLNLEKNNTLNAQIEAYKQERIARKERENALRIQKQANEMLEQRVRERTVDLQQANEMLENLSITDALTGLKNRRYFDEVYIREFKRAIRDQTPLSVLIIDIDHFKEFNDTYGHLTGDLCLKMVAERIEDELHRVSDLAFRYGGEEFCVLLPNTVPEGAVIVAERIRGEIESAGIEFNDQTLSVTISIGLASHIPSQTMEPEELMGIADNALYHSKESGRNRVTVYNVPEDG